MVSYIVESAGEFNVGGIAMKKSCITGKEKEKPNFLTIGLFSVESRFFREFSGVADGARTRNHWNHNPEL